METLIGTAVGGLIIGFALGVFYASRKKRVIVRQSPAPGDPLDIGDRHK